jgi:hypothetical protein
MKAFIKILESSCYCECCGSYENVEAVIEVDGKKDIRSYNTHLGGDGSWENTYDHDELFLSVFNLLGYTVSVLSPNVSSNFSLGKQQECMSRECVEKIGNVIFHVTEADEQGEVWVQKIEINERVVWGVSEEEPRYSVSNGIQLAIETIGCEVWVHAEHEAFDLDSEE